MKSKAKGEEEKERLKERKEQNLIWEREEKSISPDLYF